MMAKIAYQKLDRRSPLFWGLFTLYAFILCAGLGAAYVMEHNGHIITGMTNQIVWGVPHVFAVFLTVAASVGLNAGSVPPCSTGRNTNPMRGCRDCSPLHFSL